MGMGRMYCERCGDEHGALAKCQKSSESATLPCSTPDEFELMDTLAVKLGLSAPMSQEERNMSSLYKRRVLKEAIKRLDEAWNKE